MKYSHNSKKAPKYSVGLKGYALYFTCSVLVLVIISLLFFATPLRHAASSNQNKQKASLPVPNFNPKKPEKPIGSGKKKSVGQQAIPLVFTHENIITTVFWVGESASSDNGGIANKASAWDESWQQHFGGVDTPTSRSGYKPASFTPNENPFYVALPYNDLTDMGNRKSQSSGYLSSAFVSATRYPWFKNSWIAIKYNNKIAYAQWEDVGPYEEDDAQYVFGTAKPKNQRGQKAGLDISPAVKNYLGLSDVSSTAWAFVQASQVPGGPWKEIVTTYPGEPVD